MRILVTAMALSYVLASGCDVGQMSAKQGSGIVSTQVREVEPFHGITLSGSGGVDISIGSPQSVSIKFDDNLIQDVVTQVDNGELKIHVDENYSSSVGLQIEIVTESLDEIDVSGAGTVTAKKIETGNLSTRISGVGKISLTGTADTLAVKISGAGILEATDLTTKTAGVSVSGVGKANIHSTQSVDAAISGAGKVNIYGNPPKVKKQVTGAGKINIK